MCRERVTKNRNQASVQVLIPPEDYTTQNAILYQSHDGPMSGHFGNKRTLKRAQDSYYWPRLGPSCKQYVRSCQLCQLHKAPAPKATNRLLKPSIPYAVNARLGIDLIGPLAKSTNNDTYALVIIDYFTKWAVVVPIKNKEAESVAQAIFNNWYLQYGIPYEIHTDQGSEFTNDLLKRLNSHMSIGYRVTTPYYPQANGTVERFN